MGLPHSPKTDGDRLIKDNRANTSQQSLKSRAIKGKERGVAVDGCHSSVAERWRLKPEALRSIPGGATFLSLCRFKGLWAVTAPIVFN